MGFYTSFVEPVLTGVPFQELAEPEASPKEVFSEKGFEATQFFLVAWADRFRFVKMMMGGPTGYVYVLPARYADFPPATCVSVEIDPWGKPTSQPGQKLTWEFAKLTVKFATREWENEQQRLGEVLISESIEGAAEFLTVPAEGLFWDKAMTEAIADTEAPGKIYKTITWNYTLHKINVIPPEIWDWVGKVNKDKVASLTYTRTFDPETLLFNPPSLRREITAGEIRSWEVNLHLTYRPEGWNKFQRKGSTLYQPMYSQREVRQGNSVVQVTGEHKVYEPTSFGTLFKKVA